MRVTTFVVNFSKLLSQLSIALILITGAMAAYPKASGIVVAVTGFFGTLIYIFSRKRVESHSKQLANIGVSLNKTSLSALQAIREILIYRKQTAFEHQHKKQLDEYVTEYPIPLVLQSIPPLVLEFSGAATLLLAFFYMQDQGVSLSQISGTLALLAGVAWRLLPCLNKAVAALLVLHSCNPFIDQFFFNFKRIPADYEANYLPLDFQQEIRMTNLSFRYDESKKDSLVNINLTISKGKMIGLVGQSGAGKSTIVAILSGLLTPTAGAMYVDGTPVDLSNFHGFTRLGYVPQSPYLLDATLAENVAFCRWGEEPNREKVLECCEMAAVDFIDQLPYGIETIVGERGMRLSGGQVQRLAIARALYNNPSIIIFDEATSALDGAAEAALQQTINSLREKMTLVVIAHRLSTVENCDEIYWLDQGHVVDSGPAGRVLDAYNQSLLARRNTEPQE
jgi:ABC-type bacteriocin/lantibiotic exporter with double-glycine peptidase domain